MKYKKLLKLAKPYLEKNELGIGHTIRVLNIAKKNYNLYNIKEPNKDIVFSLVVLHDIGGPNVKDQYTRGPVIAKELMKSLNYSSNEINLICRIIAKHHERLENPHRIFRILFDSDRLVMFSKEEFGYYDSKPNFNWDNIVDSFYNDYARKSAKKLLKQRIKNGKKKNNKN